MTTFFHVCIPTEKAIELLMKGKNPLNCSPGKALKELTDQRNAGKEFFTGCNQEDKTGRCKGHKTK